MYPKVTYLNFYDIGIYLLIQGHNVAFKIHLQLSISILLSFSFTRLSLIFFSLKNSKIFNPYTLNKILSQKLLIYYHHNF